jgi:hypothetical protein
MCVETGCIMVWCMEITWMLRQQKWKHSVYKYTFFNKKFWKELMMHTFLKMHDPYGEAGRNYKVIIVQFNDSFMCIILIIQIPALFSLPDTTSEFYSITMSVIVNI